MESLAGIRFLCGDAATANCGVAPAPAPAPAPSWSQLFGAADGTPGGNATCPCGSRIMVRCLACMPGLAAGGCVCVCVCVFGGGGGGGREGSGPPMYHPSVVALLRQLRLNPPRSACTAAATASPHPTPPCYMPPPLITPPCTAPQLVDVYSDPTVVQGGDKGPIFGLDAGCSTGDTLHVSARAGMPCLCLEDGVELWGGSPSLRVCRPGCPVLHHQQFHKYPPPPKKKQKKTKKTRRRKKPPPPTHPALPRLATLPASLPPACPTPLPRCAHPCCSCCPPTSTVGLRPPATWRGSRLRQAPLGPSLTGEGQGERSKAVGGRRGVLLNLPATHAAQVVQADAGAALAIFKAVNSLSVRVGAS